MSDLINDLEEKRKKDAEQAGRKFIKEEDGLQDKWYEEANKLETLVQLKDFVEELMYEYEHDYGTICHAITASAVAMCWVFDKQCPSGGITGFQASAIMWEFIQHWTGDTGPMRLQKFDEMIFPQNRDKFEKTISKNIFEHIQKRASKMLEDSPGMHPGVKAHMESIVEGEVPFGYAIKD